MEEEQSDRSCTIKLQKDSLCGVTENIQILVSSRQRQALSKYQL
jgi:hypothetical protein